ncbi:MAG: ABC transporter permease subunit [Symbiobacteriaceae bacterium]|nr:ABC transporter permease subunit [Symbiobacteriaceae bacterium]
MKRLLPYLASASALLFWLVCWHLLALRLNSEILLVTPLKVGARLGELVGRTDFWRAITTTLSNILRGFFLACLVGIVLAALSQHRGVFTLLNPPLSLMKATPVASFTILVLFWVPSSSLAVVISFMMVLPIVYYNLYEGWRQVDPKLLEMATVFRLGLWSRLRYIITPSILPYFVSAISIGFGQAWKSGIAAEVIALPRNSIGINLYNAKLYLANADLLAWTVVIVLLSYLLEQGLLHLIRWLSERGG